MLILKTVQQMLSVQHSRLRRCIQLEHGLLPRSGTERDEHRPEAYLDDFTSRHQQRSSCCDITITFFPDPDHCQVRATTMGGRSAAEDQRTLVEFRKSPPRPPSFYIQLPGGGESIILLQAARTST